MTDQKEKKPPSCEAYDLRFYWFNCIWRLPLSPAAKVVAYAICQAINRESGKAYKARETMGNECSMSRRNVRYAIAELERQELIIVSDRKGGRGRAATIELLRLDEVRTAKKERKPGDLIRFKACTFDPPLERQKCARLARKGAETPSETIPPFAPDLSSFLKEDHLKASGESGTPGREWPSGYVPAASTDNGAAARIGTSAAGLLGYGLGKKIGDQYADSYLLSQIPARMRADLVARARRGKLSFAELGECLVALGVPAAPVRLAEAS